jgi:protein-tyrosine phosphatase
MEESLRCARRMVAAGYTHSFCTPHFWPNLPKITVKSIPQWVAELQAKLDAEGVPLKLYPGGEINLRADLMKMPIAELPTFCMAGKYVMFDLWADRLPAFFEPTVKWMQAGGLTVILAHPERMRAVQDEPGLADYFAELGLLLQGNLQCFNDPPNAPTRRTAERFLAEDRYFLLGSDLHNMTTLQHRMDGLARAIELAGEERVRVMTVENPRRLLTR